jgi:hypothetical protein
MLFVDWGRVGFVVILLALLAASIYGSACAKKLRSKPMRIAIRVVSVPLGTIASLAALLLLAASGCESYSTPIYSPSGKLAARIEYSDGGATGGETYVELFWAHGFREQTLYEGEWMSVRQSDIKWNSNADLVIHYSAAYNPDHHCYLVDVVRFSCLPR